MLLRPLREFPSSEVSTYATLHDLDTVSTPSVSDLVSDVWGCECVGVCRASVGSVWVEVQGVSH